MSEYIIDGPERYPRQTVRRYCGMYAAQSIVECFGGSREDLAAYASNGFTRLHGLSFPAGVASVLERHGFTSACISYRSYSPNERLSALKQSLEKGYPIIALIGAGHTQTGEFSRLKAIIFQHYVTVWGYNDDEQVFYVYDSGKYAARDENIPVGTVRIPYDAFMHYRNRGGLGLFKNLAISVTR